MADKNTIQVVLKLSADQFKKGVNGVVEQTKRLKLAFIAVGSVLAAITVRQLFRVNKEFQSLRLQLITLTGSAEKAEIAFKGIQRFAAKTPFDVAQVTQAFIKLGNLGLAPSERALTSYGNTASAMGKSLSQLIEAVADATTNEFERLKEFGIKAKQEGDNVTFTFKGVSTTVKKEAGAIQDYLIELGETEFAGGMERQAESIEGALSNLGDSWDNFLDRVAGKKSEGVLTDALKFLSNFIDGAGEVFSNLEMGGITKGIKVQEEALERLNQKLKVVSNQSEAVKRLGIFTSAEDVKADIALVTNKLQELNDKQAVLVKKQEERNNKSIDGYSDIANALDKTGNKLTEYGKKFKTAKETETRVLQKELAKQLTAYDKHLKGLADANQQRLDIAKEFADLINELNTGSGEEVEEPDILDFASAITNARKALSNGDYDGAINGAQGLAEMIRTMRDNGTEADLVLQGLAQQAADLANDATSQKVGDEEKKLADSKKTIEELVAKAKQLKDIEVDFNDELAKANLERIRQALQQEMNKNPLVMAIQMGQSDGEKAANALLKEQGITPLSPEIKPLPDNTTPIIRPLQLDTSEAERQINAITEQAAKPVVKELYVNAAGNSFSDRRSNTEAIFKDEALKTGKR